MSLVQVLALCRFQVFPDYSCSFVLIFLVWQLSYKCHPPKLLQGELVKKPLNQVSLFRLPRWGIWPTGSLWALPLPAQAWSCLISCCWHGQLQTQRYNARAIILNACLGKTYSFLGESLWILPHRAFALLCPPNTNGLGCFFFCISTCHSSIIILHVFHFLYAQSEFPQNCLEMDFF